MVRPDKYLIKQWGFGLANLFAKFDSNPDSYVVGQLNGNCDIVSNIGHQNNMISENHYEAQYFNQK